MNLMDDVPVEKRGILSETGEVGTTAVQKDSEYPQTGVVASSGDPEYRICRVVLATDVEWRNARPDDWANYMYAAIYDMSAKYEAQVGIKCMLRQIVEIPAGACTSTDNEVLIVQFRDWMQVNQPDVSRDLAFLCTGKNLDDLVIGRALDIPGVGSMRYFNDDRAYALCHFSIDTFDNAFLMGHEIGHLFNGVHPYSHYKDNWIGRDELSWMFPGYNDEDYIMVMDFTDANENRIETWGKEVLDGAFMINPGPSGTTAEKLVAQGFSIESAEWWYSGSSTKQVYFRIDNTQSSDVTVSSLYLAAKAPPGWKTKFGAISNVRIPAKSYIEFTTNWYPAQGGSWDLWPEYVNSNNKIVAFSLHLYPVTHYALIFRQGPDTQTSETTWEDVSLFYRFYLFSCFTNNLNYVFVGDTVKAYFSLFSAQAGGVDDWDCDDYATFNYFFVVCRNPYNNNKDFGSSGEVSLSLVSHSAAVGGGASVFAESPTLDATGTWSFWPSYNWGGQFGEFGWNEIDITVIEPTPPPACVLEGTQILLPDGTSKPIEDLKKGDSIAGYDIGSGEFVSEIVMGNMRSHVSSVIDINHGLLVVTQTCQPIYVRHDSFAGWVTDSRDLQVGWEIFSPTSGTWVLITSLDLLQGRFVVYDLGATSPDNYVANGLLLDRKPHK